jgi:hypothetical protein
MRQHSIRRLSPQGQGRRHVGHDMLQVAQFLRAMVAQLAKCAPAARFNRDRAFRKSGDWRKMQTSKHV